jgi:hypothetical protein
VCNVHTGSITPSPHGSSLVNKVTYFPVITYDGSIVRWDVIDFIGTLIASVRTRRQARNIVRLINV